MHRGLLRFAAKQALNKGICLFVSECNTGDATGNGNLDMEETRIWWEFLDKNRISWCNFAIGDKNETASALIPGANANGGWKDFELTLSGKLVRSEIVEKNSPILK